MLCLFAPFILDLHQLYRINKSHANCIRQHRCEHRREDSELWPCSPQGNPKVYLANNSFKLLNHHWFKMTFVKWHFFPTDIGPCLFVISLQPKSRSWDDDRLDKNGKLRLHMLSIWDAKYRPRPMYAPEADDKILTESTKGFDVTVDVRSFKRPVEGRVNSRTWNN